VTSGSKRTQRIALVATAVLLGAAVATAWVVDIVTPDSAYTIKVVEDERVLAEYDIDALKQFEWRAVRMQGQLQEGPPLSDVLKASGVSSFDRVVVSGPGVRDDGIIELDADEIDEDVLLDIAVRGTAKLCGPNIEWEDRVRDVHTIEVR